MSSYAVTLTVLAASVSNSCYAVYSLSQIIRTFLRERVLPVLRAKRDVFLLDALAEAWENHKLMDKWMGKFFRYLVSALDRCIPGISSCFPFRYRKSGSVSHLSQIHCYPPAAIFLSPQNKYYVEHKALPTLQEAAVRAFKDEVYTPLKVRYRAIAMKQTGHAAEGACHRVAGSMLKIDPRAAGKQLNCTASKH